MSGFTGIPLGFEASVFCKIRKESITLTASDKKIPMQSDLVDSIVPCYRLTSTCMASYFEIGEF